MVDILTKLSSYNIFNYLLPGIVFAVFAGKATHYDLAQKDIVVGAFIYYFIGMVVSRFGSLVIEPALKRLSLLRFAEYKDFVVASKKDEKIDLLSEANNTYRTMVSTFILLILLKLYEKLELSFPTIQTWRAEFLIGALLVMFLFAYKKQTEYISKRVKANL